MIPFLKGWKLTCSSCGLTLQEGDTFTATLVMPSEKHWSGKRGDFMQLYGTA